MIPMGIVASFSKVTFKKDGAEIFSANVTSGGCFGPTPDIDVINAGYAELRSAIRKNKIPAASIDFNAVSVRGHEYAVSSKGPYKIDAAGLKRLNP